MNNEKKMSLLSDEDVELELVEIRASAEYQAAYAEQKLKYKRRQQLYQARWMYKHGKELLKDGKDAEYFKSLDSIEDDE